MLRVASRLWGTSTVRIEPGVFGVLTIVKRLLTGAKKTGRTEDGIESLESGGRPPTLSPTVKVEEDRVVLLVDAFCWGVRKMVLNLNADAKRMATAEASLEEVGKP